MKTTDKKHNYEQPTKHYEDTEVKIPPIDGKSILYQRTFYNDGKIDRIVVGLNEAERNLASSVLKMNKELNVFKTQQNTKFEYDVRSLLKELLTGIKSGSIELNDYSYLRDEIQTVLTKAPILFKKQNPTMNLTEQEYADLHELYSYELHLDTSEANQFGFTSNKYSGYIYVDYGDYYLHCKNIDGTDADLSILRENIYNFGIPYEDIRNP